MSTVSCLAQLGGRNFCRSMLRGFIFGKHCNWPFRHLEVCTKIACLLLHRSLNGNRERL